MRDALETKTLQSYFGQYSPSAKAYGTQGNSDLFFQEVVKFLLEVVCVSPHSYCMPKQREGFIIVTYEGEKIEWGYIMGITLKEQLHGMQKVKSLNPIFTRWLLILCSTPNAQVQRTTPRKEKGKPS